MAGYLLLSDPSVSPPLYLLYLQEVELWDKQRADSKTTNTLITHQ